MYPDVLPKGIEARPVLDTLNYLPDSLRQPVLNILKSKSFDLAKCFIDKQIRKSEKEQTISIRIWDVEDLKFRKASEKKTQKYFLPKRPLLFGNH